METKPYALAIRIYEKSNGVVMADVKTSPCNGSKIETIVQTRPNEREKFCYDGFTLFYDERVKKTKPFEEIN